MMCLHLLPCIRTYNNKPITTNKSRVPLFYVHNCININMLGLLHDVKFKVHTLLNVILLQQYTNKFNSEPILEITNEIMRMLQNPDINNAYIIKKIEEIKGSIRTLPSPINTMDDFKLAYRVIFDINESISEIITIMWMDNYNSFNSGKPPAKSSGGGSNKLHILGRDRKVIIKDNVKHVTYNRNLITLNVARKLEKCKL